MTKMAMLILPALVIVGFIAWKLPEKAKDVFFKIPVWISATGISWGLGHFMVAGVMGPYAILVMDLVLMPCFAIIKKAREKKKAWKAARAAKAQKIGLQVVQVGAAAAC